MNQDMALLFAPLTLLLGGGLFAAGALSFLNTHFFKTKFLATAALAAGLAFIVLTEFIFAMASGSGRFLSAQKALVSECELDAEAALPHERHMKSVAMQDYIVGCMRGSGYEWTTEHRRCRAEPIAMNAFCYLPVRPFTRAVTRIQMKFE